MHHRRRTGDTDFRAWCLDQARASAISLMASVLAARHTARAFADVATALKPRALIRWVAGEKSRTFHAGKKFPF